VKKIKAGTTNIQPQRFFWCSMPRCNLSVFIHGTFGINPNVANVGGLQIQGVKGEVVVLYFESLTTQNLKSSGVPEGVKKTGIAHGPSLFLNFRIPDPSWKNFLGSPGIKRTYNNYRKIKRKFTTLQ